MDLLLEILDRTLNGPICSTKEWELKILPRRTATLLEEHGLRGTCDKENPVNPDDGLADDFWAAGFELAVETGMLCLDTERIVKFSEEELISSLRKSPKKLVLGRGGEAKEIVVRSIEDARPPITSLSFMGPVSEDLYVLISQAVAQYRIIDMTQGSTLAKIKGRRIISKTTFEALAKKYKMQLQIEALKRVNRLGMPILIDDLSSLGLYDQDSILLASFSYEPLKFNYSELNKIAHCIYTGVPIYAAHLSNIGGYFGCPEGVVIGAIAAQILQTALMRPSVVESGIIDMRYLGNCGREAIWANSVCRQACSRNAGTIDINFVNQVSGPCTEMILLETAAASIAGAVSGIAIGGGTTPRRGKFVDYGSGLENKFCAEIYKCSSRLRRRDANEIVKGILPKYEEELNRPPVGRSFIECTDVGTLKPNKEWLDIYEDVWSYIEDAGVSRDMP